MSGPTCVQNLSALPQTIGLGQKYWWQPSRAECPPEFGRTIHERRRETTSWYTSVLGQPSFDSLKQYEVIMSNEWAHLCAKSERPTSDHRPRAEVLMTTIQSWVSTRVWKDISSGLVSIEEVYRGSFKQLHVTKYIYHLSCVFSERSDAAIMRTAL